jgi:hypothetical protein
VAVRLTDGAIFLPGLPSITTHSVRVFPPTRVAVLI